MIKSVTTNGQKFQVGMCIPGTGNGPVIADIREGASTGSFGIYDKDRHLIAAIDNCPCIVLYEQKEPRESVTL